MFQQPGFQQPAFPAASVSTRFNSNGRVIRLNGVPERINANLVFEERSIEQLAVNTDPAFSDRPVIQISTFTQPTATRAEFESPRHRRTSNCRCSETVRPDPEFQPLDQSCPAAATSDTFPSVMWPDGIMAVRMGRCCIAKSTASFTFCNGNRPPTNSAKGNC